MMVGGICSLMLCRAQGSRVRVQGVVARDQWPEYGVRVRVRVQGLVARDQWPEYGVQGQ